MNLARRAIRYELGMWRSLYRWIARKPYGEGVRFSYASLITPVLVGIIVVSFIEIPVMHMIVPWEKAKFIGEVLSVAISSRTNVDVVLRQPYEGATELRFYADDASGLVKLATAARLERQAG